jgi:hypothetical protein
MIRVMPLPRMLAHPGPWKTWRPSIRQIPVAMACAVVVALLGSWRGALVVVAISLGGAALATLARVLRIGAHSSGPYLTSLLRQSIAMLLVAVALAAWAVAELLAGDIVVGAVVAVASVIGVLGFRRGLIEVRATRRAQGESDHKA